MENKFFYRPKENHLGIIYSDRFGYDRFVGFANETQAVWLGPKFLTRRYVLKEHYLGPRTVHLFLSRVVTADRVSFDLELKVFYRVDPRNAAPENLIQILNMADAGFESIVKTNTEEKIRNDVFTHINEDDLFEEHGRKYLRTTLSARVAKRVSELGITVNSEFGVAIMNIQPTEDSSQDATQIKKKTYTAKRDTLIFNEFDFEIERDLCFVLMPFSPTWSRELFDNYIKPACSEEGFIATRADDIYGIRGIMQDIWSHINKARIVIADLTTKNPNVFYEVGLAHALGKDVILITQTMDDVPFDLRAVRCIVYSLELTGPAKLGHDLKSTMAKVISE